MVGGLAIDWHFPVRDDCRWQAAENPLLLRVDRGVSGLIRATERSMVRSQRTRPGRGAPTPSRPRVLPRRGAASVCSLHSARSCARLTSGRYRRAFHGFRRIRTGSCPKISSPRSFFPLAERSSHSSTSATAPLCPAIDGSKQAHETIDCQRADLNPTLVR